MGFNSSFSAENNKENKDLDRKTGQSLSSGLQLSGQTLQSISQPNSSTDIIGQSLSLAGTGASLGTAIAPGIGTAIGAGLGAAAGLATGFINSERDRKLRQQQEAERIRALSNQVSNRSNQVLSQFPTQGIQGTSIFN
jgi:uncharacterized protein YcfJ